MLEEIRNIIDRNLPDLEGKKFLLAVSGGIDSVVLVHCFTELKLNFGIAHCNFGLRGQESDGDEQFVRELGEKSEVPVYSRFFETEEASKERGISIQMAARDLRYEWFLELAKKHRFDYIVTAHHQNDQAETFFINLIRGTGLEGLTGMQIAEGNLFRPLLPFQKNEIIDYAEKNKLKWREDSSNIRNDYIRNRIRNLVFPELEKIAPAFVEVLSGNMDKLRETWLIYKSTIDQKKEKLLIKNDFGYEIDMKQLLKEAVPQLVLFETLRSFHFHYNSCKTIISDHKTGSGKKFFSTSHRLVNHRGTLLITRITPEDIIIHEIPEGVNETDTPVHLKITKLQPPVELVNDASVALLDATRIRFPLVLRKWHKGDMFVPLGMKGRKKLSDYFIDQKFSLVQKENTWLLCSEDLVVWVVGHRIDDRFKITEKTKQVIKIELIS